MLPNSAGLLTKATSRVFFPGARVTVRDGGAASTAVSSMKFLCCWRDLIERKRLVDQRYRHK